MTMINYTPHVVTVRSDDGTEFVYPPSGTVARVEMLVQRREPLEDGCPIISAQYGDAELPADHPSRCIVSTMFADAYRAQHRGGTVELFVPDSGPSAHRQSGQIVAVRSLIRR